MRRVNAHLLSEGNCLGSLWARLQPNFKPERQTRASESAGSLPGGPMFYESINQWVNESWVNETHSQYSNNLLIKPKPPFQWLGLSTLWNFSVHLMIWLTALTHWLIDPLTHDSLTHWFINSVHFFARGCCLGRNSLIFVNRTGRGQLIMYMSSQFYLKSLVYLSSCSCK